MKNKTIKREKKLQEAIEEKLMEKVKPEKKRSRIPSQIVWIHCISSGLFKGIEIRKIKEAFNLTKLLTNQCKKKQKQEELMKKKIKESKVKRMINVKTETVLEIVWEETKYQTVICKTW